MGELGMRWKHKVFHDQLYLISRPVTIDNAKKNLLRS